MLIAKDVIFYLLIVNLIGKARSALGDPYKILGVQRSAHADEIRRAYKRLVRAYHPDKTSDPGAEDLFVKVTKAYELLMDPDRRNEFDLYGTTEDAPNFRQKRDQNLKLYEFERFGKFPAESSSPFNPDPNQIFSFLSQTISAKAYQNRILPLSITSPQLILFYDDSCVPCSDVEPVWHKISLELEPLGVGISTMNSEQESTLARKINIPVDLPYIIGIVDGVVRHYKETSLSLSRMIEFIRRILPRKLVTQVNDDNYESFLSGWSDNRVRVLFVNGDKTVKLRYSLTAFHFRERAVCGHVNSKAEDSQKLITRYGVDAKMDSMLIFNEDMSRPIASLAATELKPQIIKDILQSNKYLLLPRLTSQIMFDQICPPELARSRRNLCVMLVTNNIPTEERQLEAMRNFILENELHQERFRFMYIFQEKQKEFVNSLTIGPNFPKDPASHVVVLWRRDQERLLFEWLTSKWDVSGSETLNRSKSELFELLNKLSKTTHSMTNNAKMVNLIDEQANWFFSRILKKFLVLTDGIGDNISTKDFFPVASVVLAFAFIIFIGLIMQQSMKYEESRIREQYRRIGRVPPGLKPKNDCKLNIHELRGETYNGLIRLLKPGCRTIILLCGARTKAKLLPKFYRCVYPYRKNKTLMFAYLLIEKNIDWYKKLLLQNLDHLDDLNINPKNVIGTVLAVNGFKRYFCVYHVKHSEQRRPTEDDFLGFDSQDEEDIEAGAIAVGRPSPELDPSDIVFENNLLDGLPQWLERLFEGTTHRYGIQYWPDNMK